MISKHDTSALQELEKHFNTYFVEPERDFIVFQDSFLQKFFTMSS